MPEININKLWAEIREEILREQTAETERQRINSRTFSKVLNEFEDEFKKFNWAETEHFPGWDGVIVSHPHEHCEEHKVKAAFRVKSARSIPASKEAHLRKITQDILNIVMHEITEAEQAA